MIWGVLQIFHYALIRHNLFSKSQFYKYTSQFTFAISSSLLVFRDSPRVKDRISLVICPLFLVDEKNAQRAVWEHRAYMTVLLINRILIDQTFVQYRAAWLSRLCLVNYKHSLKSHIWHMCVTQPSFIQVFKMNRIKHTIVLFYKNCLIATKIVEIMRGGKQMRNKECMLGIYLSPILKEQS